MNQNSEDGVYLFKPAQFLGQPAIFPPPVVGKLQIAVQFIIPGFVIGRKNRETIIQIAKKCSPEVFTTHSKIVEETTTKRKATLVTIAFYTNPIVKESEPPGENQVFFQALLLVERFLSLLSFFVGTKLTGINIQPTIKKNGQYSQVLPVIRRTSVPRARVDFSVIMTDVNPTDTIFSALSWFRRGMAERDPVETFSAFMVCLQIIARQLISGQSTEDSCPHCGGKLGTHEPSVTSLVRELIVLRLGASKALFERIWKMRNAVIAHGNVPVTPEILLKLTELKFEAGKLALEAIKLSLGMPLDMPPFLNQTFFITDAFMYVD